MNNIYMRKLKFSLVFTAFIFLGITNVHAQQASLPPFVKYAVNNFSSIAKAACDSCVPEVSAPLQKFRPIPFPEAGPFKLATGIDVSAMPGLMVPNFWGGGSPEIKGYMQSIAGILDERGKTGRLGELLYFKGAKGVAISKQSNTIYTSAPTITLGKTPLDTNGFFTFKSTPAIMPKFNSVSDKTFEGSPIDYKVYVKSGQDPDVYNNHMTETVYFTIDPNNEKIMYASMRNPADTAEKGLFRKNGADGWYLLDSSEAAVWGALAVDNSGNLYIADPNKNIIVKATFDFHGNASSWITIAGTDGTAGFKNDNGVNALFKQPSGICIDNNTGNIYVGDAGNNRVRKIDNDGDVTTYAGTGAAGFVDDNSASDAKFNSPTAMAYNETTGSLFVVDYNNNLIREIDKDRHVTTLAGNPGKWLTLDPTRIAMQFYFVLAKLNLKPDEAKLDRPTGIAIDPSGHGLYVSDYNYIRYVSTFPAQFVLTSAFRELDSTQLPLPILPLGLRFDSDNGAFYGIPLMPWPPTTYTISVINSRGGSFGLANGFITIEVADCPEKTDTVVINKTISLSQLPYTWNGKRLDSAGTVAVTRKTRLGCDSVTVLNLSIYPELAYNSEPYILSLGQQIKPIVPRTAGSIIETFSVAPPLPAGLSLNAQTGEITGIPLATTSSQPVPAVGPQTPPQYPGPWALKADNGADLTEFKISDGNGKTVFENNSAFKRLVGSAGQGTGTAGAYTDFSGLGAIKMFSNSPYSVRLSNALAGGYGSYPMNQLLSYLNFMNSYAVYIDYNRDGDFADGGERVYISAGPQRDAHTEMFNLNIPVTAKSGVTKMRIYAVEAQTYPWTYRFYNPDAPILGQYTYVDRTTEQALSFYPFFDNISSTGEHDFHGQLDYGEFEDYTIDIVSPVTESYVVTGSNAVGSVLAAIKIAVNRPTTSSNNLTICSNQLPYKWNNLTFYGAGTKTDTLRNVMLADSLATLNLTVKQTSSSVVEVAHCGPYTYLGQVYRETGNYYLKIPNAAGCDSSITFKFRQKATASTNSLVLTPNDLPYYWNDRTFRTAGTQSDTLINGELCDSIATLTLLVQYNITYATNNLLTLNKTITPINPQIQGGYVPPGVWYVEAYGYSISPALPAGLSLNPVTGVISGTPTELSPLKMYTIKLNQEGAQLARFTLSVGAPSFSTTTIDNCGPLTWNNVVYDKAGTGTYLTTNQYGYDSTATLIVSIRNLSASTTDLNLNLSQLPFTWNDTIIRKEGLYTVHRLNSVGCDSAARASVVISPKIKYVSPQTLLHNQAITAITPQSLGGRVLNYTITPSLVTGLQFDASSGTISGTPVDTLVQPVTYTVLATNRAGTDTTKLVIAVCNAMATAFTMNICDRFVWNDSIYTTSTTHTRTFKNRGGCDSTSTMNLVIRKSSRGRTETITACSSYTWYDVKYETTGIYPKVFRNAAGCDSTILLNLTVNYPSVNNLYVNLNASDLPYMWRGKTFTVPGTDTIFLRNGNNVGCDSTVRMTVSISALLPDITYAVKDTVLYWEQRIETPIAMTNTGTAVPAMKLGESDTLIKFANAGPGDHIRNTVKGANGAYYSRVPNSSQVFKLSSSGVWAPFADAGSSINGLAIDASGNLYVALNALPSYIKKITPDGSISNLPGSPLFYTPDNVFVDGNNTLFILDANNYTQLDIVKYNLSDGQQVEMKLDNSPYFQFGPEDMKVDSKGNIYIYKNSDNVLVKIRPDGRMSSIGRKGSDYSVFRPGNGPDATLPTISSIAIDPTNDNLYIMAGQQLLRVDTAENVTAISGKSFDYWYQIFRVDGGKVYVINNSKGRLFTSNIYGVGSLPFMDNYGANGVNSGTVNYTDFDKRIRLDSSGGIVGTPRATYSSIGTKYGTNKTTGYSIIAANQHGISTAPMTITTKDVYYKRESFVTTTLPFVWRGRSFYAATDTARYFIANRLEVCDTIYMLHLVYEGPPAPFITKSCAEGGFSLAAAGAAKSAISFDGTTWGRIKNVDRGGDGHLPYYNLDWIPKPGGSQIANFRSAFEVWIKPASVDGIQYLLTRDSVKTNGTFMGYSIQNGKFMFEFTKGLTPSLDFKVSSVRNIEKNVWTHVAASFYDSAMYIFINGKLDTTLQTNNRFINPWYEETPGSTVLISPDFYLGGLPGKNGYKGEMDELRLFNTRRNEDSIKATMNTILDPKRGGLGLYYRFDGDVTDGVMDISMSGRRAVFTKPPTSVENSGAPINFASHSWMPGGETAKSIVVNPVSSTTYTVTVKDYKESTASASLLVHPAQGPSITAPAAVARTNTPTSCGVVVSDVDLGSAIATDNCPGVIVKRTGVPAGNLFPLGVTTITYTAINMSGRTKSATQTVTISDIHKPAFTISLSVNPGVIWPPDHKMKNITLAYTTADNCGTVTNNVTVTSTDPITGVSDGDISPDWIVTNDHLVQLRAERGNGKEARVYTITVTPVDSSGNMGTPQSVNVYIAHNITGPITGTSFKIGSIVNFSGVFWDKQGNKHTGEWVIDDNTIVNGTVTEPLGTRNGKLTGSYKFITAGTYKLRMNITDQDRVTSYCNTNEDMEAIVVIYDPAGGFTYGGGWFASPLGALKSDATATGKANFGYAVSYFKGAANPKGETQFELKVGDLEYNALNFEYLSIDGARAQIKGTGKITGGQSGINFIMTVIDGALDGTGIDKVRIKIYNRNTGQVYYDNEQGSEANNPVTKVGTNSQIVIGGTSVNTSSSAAVATKANTPAARIEDASIRQGNVMASLQAKAFPNPSHGYFTLLVQGKNNEPVSIRVSDIMGRLVEVRKGLPANGTLTLGASYRPGVYIAEVLQGKEKVLLKLIKLSE